MDSKSLVQLTASVGPGLWRATSGLQCAHACAPSWCHALILWMLAISFGDASLTTTILVKVSLCDSMKSITQIVNFVNAYWAQEMSGIDFFLHSCVASFGFSLFGRQRPEQFRGEALTFVFLRSPWSQVWLGLSLILSLRSLSLIKTQRFPGSY